MFKFKFPSLMPRNDKFSVLLLELSADAALSVTELKHYLDAANDADRQKADAAILQARTKTKAQSQLITQELWRSYITPFDREDIQAFAFELYKIPKIIEKVKERLHLPGLQGGTDDFKRQIDLIAQEAAAMTQLVRAMVEKNDETVRTLVSTLHELEVEGDNILGELLVDLFASERDARDLILRRDIYDMLEKGVDRYRDAAAVALRIVLKHS